MKEQKTRHESEVEKNKEISKKWLKGIDNDNKAWYNIITIKKTQTQN